MSSDYLQYFKDKSTCPNCGCIDVKGTFRCVGCGTFHSTAHLIERDAPPIESRIIDDIEIDPSAYSMGPNQIIPEESFEQSDEVINWEGSSSDFSIPENSDKVLTEQLENNIKHSQGEEL